MLKEKIKIYYNFLYSKITLKTSFCSRVFKTWILLELLVKIGKIILCSFLKYSIYTIIVLVILQRTACLHIPRICRRSIIFNRHCSTSDIIEHSQRWCTSSPACCSTNTSTSDCAPINFSWSWPDSQKFPRKYTASSKLW